MSTDEVRAVEVDDERSPLARQAVELIREAIRDVQPTADLLSEIEERRRDLPSGGDYHLIAFLGPDDRVVAAAAGVYLEAVNAGFITYLAVRADYRGRLLGRELRQYLVDAFWGDAQERYGTGPAWTVGEIRRESRWLRTLVREGGAIPFDLGYFHPWMPLGAEGRYVLYREPIEDRRAELPPHEVASLLYAIWRRAYRVEYPLQSETFCYMLEQLQGRDSIGAAPGFEDE